jgi:hypothetical protein
MPAILSPLNQRNFTAEVVLPYLAYIFQLLVETDPLNHPAILTVNAGRQYTPKHPTSLVNPSKSASQSIRGG